MIKTNTLFILGAGASAPFDYPTGIKLRDDILSKDDQANIINALHDHIGDNKQPSMKEYDNFINEFLKSSTYSIDSFLEHRAEFMKVGKISIAAALIKYEVDVLLRKSESNWYMYLFNRLNASFENLDQNNISFITFNYDRSLDQFLFEAIKSSFGKIDSECIDKLIKFPIVHLYGQLGFLPWQAYGPYGSVEYKYNNIINRLRSAINNIKLINDERDVANSPEFQKAYELISNAKRIFFLGFGFDETNLERLHIELMKNKEIIGTSLGIKAAKQAMIRKYFNNRIPTGSGQNAILLDDRDVLTILQDRLRYE